MDEISLSYSTVIIELVLLVATKKAPLHSSKDIAEGREKLARAWNAHKPSGAEAINILPLVPALSSPISIAVSG
jgi:hypothetical protein